MAKKAKNTRFCQKCPQTFAAIAGLHGQNRPVYLLTENKHDNGP